MTIRRPMLAHQAREFAEHRDSPARAYLWTMRTGKTKSSIDKAFYLHTTGKIDAVLVFAPNGVHDTWAQHQLDDHAWSDVPYTAYAWEASTFAPAKTEARTARRDGAVADFKAFCAGPFPWLCMNADALVHERGIKAINQFIKGKRFFLIADEADDYRSPDSKRSRAIRGYAKRAAYRQILSGTLAGNSALDVWAPYDILKPTVRPLGERPGEPGALGFANYGELKSRYAIYEDRTVIVKGRERTFPQLVGFKDIEDLRERMAAWSSVVTRDDVVDLSPLVFEIDHVAVGPLATKAYKDIWAKLRLDLKDGTVLSAVDAGVRMLKMQQCLSGWVNNDLGDPVRFDERNDRVEALMWNVETLAAGKSIVWAWFREDIAIIADELTRRRIPFVTYYGGTLAAERDVAVKRFAQDAACSVFLGQPRAGGRGLDLSAADQIVWFSQTSNNIVREQANERATRMGGRAVTVVDLIAPNSVDTHLWGVLSRRQSLSDELAGSGLKKLLKQMDAMAL